MHWHPGVRRAGSEPVIQGIPEHQDARMSWRSRLTSYVELRGLNEAKVAASMSPRLCRSSTST